MRITSSKLLQSNKTISVVNNCLFAAEGPNCVGKMDLTGILVKYDSFFSSTMTLQPKDKFMPIMYGFLGTNVTFISIIPDYNINPQICPPDKYIEFYYEDQPMIKRTFTDILMLSGNDLHRIPQIYVYNPLDTEVILNVMVANVEVNEVSTILNPEYEVFKGLSYNSILSNKVEKTTCTGSTQYEVIDLDGNVQMIIDYAKIDIMKIEDNVITITTTSDTPIKLEFLNKFNADQAFARMNWVFERQSTRFLTPTYPTLDMTPPQITWATNYGDSMINPLRINITGATTYPITNHFLISYFIDKVEDLDGNGSPVEFINKFEGLVLIQDMNSGLIINEIIKDGRYTVTFTYQDLSGNKSIELRYIVIDSTGPEIRLQNIINNHVDMILQDTTQTPYTICYNDIVRYTVDSVWDDVDGFIDKMDTNTYGSYFELFVVNTGITYTYVTNEDDIFILPPNAVIPTPSGITCNIGLDEKGDYEILYAAKDIGKNWTITSGITLTIIDNRPIVEFKPIANGQQILMNGNIVYTYDDIRNYTIQNITSVYGSPIDISTVSLYIPNELSAKTYVGEPDIFVGIPDIFDHTITEIYSNAGYITQYNVMSGSTIKEVVYPLTKPQTIINSVGTYGLVFIITDIEGHIITFTKKLIIV